MIGSFDLDCENESAVKELLPTLAGIRYRRKTLAKLSLFAVGIPLLVRLARLLLWTRSRTTAG